ncbi:rna recognition motif domain [Fusarium longipes]|uniref:Rna recognition motif domain n=1 Tax=Fusarium longipes TaxID=694270 RepID=A0A395SQY3_9HYPO|nr:rna recognition motif domain [Fusarium longipes]
MSTIQNTSISSVLLEKPSQEILPQSRPNSTVIRSVVTDEGLPEVANPNWATKPTEYYDAPIPVDSETDKRFNEAPIPIGTLDEPAPPLPDRKSTTQYPYSPGGYAPQAPLQYSSNGGFAPHPPSYHNNEVVTYVTPLSELGDHPKFVDCPFCRHRAETRVKKTSSRMTHVSATVLGFTTIAGAAVPYAGKWAAHTTHYCTNCDHKVAIRKWGSKEMKALGTPEHMREVSRTHTHEYPSSFPDCNLPYEAKPSEIEEALAENGFDSLDKIHISVDPISARNPGYCFVDFYDRETAERALSSLSATVYGRTLKVGPCEPKKPRERRGFQSEDATSRRWGDWNAAKSSANSNGSQTNGRSETKGPNWAIDHFEDVTRDNGGRRLYVGGLDKMIDQAQHQEELAQIFTGFKPTAIGKRITPHESKRTLPGNHHYCFVDFETKEEASSAVEALNGRVISGGRLKVSVSERTPQKLASRQVDAREGRYASDRTSNLRSNKPETNNAMVSNNWRRKD